MDKTIYLTIHDDRDRCGRVKWWNCHFTTLFWPNWMDWKSRQVLTNITTPAITSDTPSSLSLSHPCSIRKLHKKTSFIHMMNVVLWKSITWHSMRLAKNVEMTQHRQHWSHTRKMRMIFVCVWSTFKNVEKISMQTLEYRVKKSFYHFSVVKLHLCLPLVLKRTEMSLVEFISKQTPFFFLSV